MLIQSLITLENGVHMTFEVKHNRLWYEMDEPNDKDMMVTIYNASALIQMFDDKETTFHQSALRQKRVLLPGTYIFTFSNDQYTKLTVEFINNKLSCEVT